MGLAQAIRLLIQRSRTIMGSTTALWNSGFATSGLPGADLITMGTANQWMRLVEGFAVISGLTPGAEVTLRSYRTIAGVERLWWLEEWDVGVGPDAIFFWWWPIEILGTSRIELFSDNPLDDNATIPYEWRRKDW